MIRKLMFGLMIMALTDCTSVAAGLECHTSGDALGAIALAQGKSPKDCGSSKIALRRLMPMAPRIPEDGEEMQRGPQQHEEVPNEVRITQALGPIKKGPDGISQSS